MDPLGAIAYWTAGKQSGAGAAELPGGAARRADVPVDWRLTPGGDVNGYHPVRRPYTATASSRVTGRLFYLDGDGERRSCSGVVVRSAGGLLVATAAHCVYGLSARTGGAVWSSKIAFVPAYDGSGAGAAARAPYGVWGARRAWKPRPFTGEGMWDWDSVYDLALVEVGRRGSATLQEAVGAVTPLRNEAGDYAVTTLGYPSDAPYDGLRQLWCQARTTPWPGYAQPARIVDGRLHTANCHLFGGNSGGPWLERASGMLVGVLSSGAGNRSAEGYAVANPLGADSYGALVRRADPRGVYDALSIKGSAKDLAKGRRSRLTATVTMRGLMAAARVPVTFRLPRGVSAPAGTGCWGTRRTVTCTLAVVRPGRPERVSLPVRVTRRARHRVTVSVAATFLDPGRRDNDHSFTMPTSG